MFTFSSFIIESTNKIYIKNWKCLYWAGLKPATPRYSNEFITTEPYREETWIPAKKKLLGAYEVLQPVVSR